LFERNAAGKFQYHADDHNHVFTNEEQFKNQHFSMNFFDGDTGKALVRPIKPDGPSTNLILELEANK
jgi:hypothetical protein